MSSAFNRRRRNVYGSKVIGTSAIWLILASLLAPMHAHAYRPFSTTDADVADAGELEIELGYFTVERTDGEDTFKIPQLVLNYGLTRKLEVIGEFEVEKSSGESGEIADAAVLLKGVIKEGALQDQAGISFAVEAGMLIPSTGNDRFGFEGLGIISGRLPRFTYHLSLGGGFDKADREEFAVWGAILELPLSPSMRLVGEVSGESVGGEKAESSALLGFIWESEVTGNSFDGGIRRGTSSAAPDWELTLGWTFSFPAK